MLGVGCPDRHALPHITSSKMHRPRRVLPSRASGFVLRPKADLGCVWVQKLKNSGRPVPRSSRRRTQHLRRRRDNKKLIYRGRRRVMNSSERIGQYTCITAKM